ncbi:hypothetical protein JTE90_017315 [Oedothorax gibbosus]|uniref:Small ribosomal subunit protein mS40 n=1 Tax=Oedothorax gibbosus TaxID=931172 RepID=A0AAV6UDJ1_9ARAC|nr:hypothetical protein JTE90_017315 [Oedothorax gibbosus]
MNTFLKLRCAPNLIKSKLTYLKPVQARFYGGFITSNGLTNVTKSRFPAVALCRSIQIGSSFFSEAETETSPEEPEPQADNPKLYKIHPVETSIRYLKSKAYQTTYGDEPVWVKYRRNFKGQFVPRLTRKSCVRNGLIETGSPCPICRDEYLVLHYTNVDLLKQFIHPKTGEIHDCRKIHVCQRQLTKLRVAVKLAKFHGLLTHEVPFRTYDYKEYYPDWKA